MKQYYDSMKAEAMMDRKPSPTKSQPTPIIGNAPLPPIPKSGGGTGGKYY
jgi:hypothetical protein